MHELTAWSGQHTEPIYGLDWEQKEYIKTSGILSVYITDCGSEIETAGLSTLS